MNETQEEWTIEQFQEFYKVKPGSVHVGKKEKKASVDYGLMLDRQIAEANLPIPVKEHRFHPTRQWRFDRAWVEDRVALEVDGGTFGRPVQCHNCGQTVKRSLKDGRMVVVREGGRHNTGQGFANDAEKLNEAVCLRWLVLRVTPEMVQDGRAIAWLKRALQ